MDIFKQTSPTRENLGMLAVLEALEGENNITQRELACVTGLNLKKVNYCLKKLLETGCVKFQRARQNPDKRTYLYILTPAGLKEKTRLTYNFLKVTSDFYSLMEVKLRRFLITLESAGIQRILIFGTGDIARIVLSILNETNIKIVGVIDEQEGVLGGIPTVPKNQLKSCVWDGILITTSGDPLKAEKQLIDMGVDASVIWKLS